MRHNSPAMIYIICLSDGSTWEVVGHDIHIFKVTEEQLEELMNGTKPHSLENAEKLASLTDALQALFFLRKEET